MTSPAGGTCPRRLPTFVKKNFISLQSRTNSDIPLRVVAYQIKQYTLHRSDSFVAVYCVNFVNIFMCHPEITFGSFSFVPLLAPNPGDASAQGHLSVKVNVIDFDLAPTTSVRENVCNNSKKRKKSCFWILKKRSFTQPLITQLPAVSTGKSRSPTSNVLLRSVDTRNYATENCV